MAFVTDSNRPQPTWQPPPTAYRTALGTASKVPPSSLRGGGGGTGLGIWRGGGYFAPWPMAWSGPLPKAGEQKPGQCRRSRTAKARTTDARCRASPTPTAGTPPRGCGAQAHGQAPRPPAQSARTSRGPAAEWRPRSPRRSSPLPPRPQSRARRSHSPAPPETKDAATGARGRVHVKHHPTAEGAGLCLMGGGGSGGPRGSYNGGCRSLTKRFGAVTGGWRGGCRWLGGKQRHEARGCVTLR